MADRKCTNCLHVYRYPSMLRHHFETTYHCKKTDAEIKAFFTLNNVNTNKSNNEYKCKKCNNEFSNLKALNRHSKETICGKSQTLQITANDTSNDTINNNLLASLISKELKQISNIINKKLLTNKPILTTSNANIEPEIIANTDNNTSINNETSDNDITQFNYIYLIEKFDVNNKEYIYKFGKTNRECSKRLKEHGDEAKLLFIIDVDNCNSIEKKILTILRNTVNIKQCTFGNEYFLCNDKEYIKTIILKNIYNF